MMIVVVVFVLIEWVDLNWGILIMVFVVVSVLGVRLGFF